MRNLICLFAMASVLVVAGACGQQQEPVETGADGEALMPKVALTFPHVLNQEHPVHKAIVKFKEEVERRSDGRITVTIFEGGTMGNEQELVDNVMAGTNSMTKVSSVILETKSELGKVFSLPYLFRGSEHMWQVLDGEIGRELLDMAVDKGLKGICYYDAGFRSFYTKEQNIWTPADLEGMKIRVQKSKMMERLIRALGAMPQQIAFSELFTALDTGVVDGAENNTPSYYTTRHYDVAPYYTYDEHVAVPDMVFMNTSQWQDLTSEQQQIIMDSAQVSSEFQRDLWDKECAEYVAKMKEAGVTFSRPDKQPFIEKTRSVYDQFEGTEIMEYVKRIRAVQ